MQERISLKNALLMFLIVAAALIAVDTAMKLLRNVKFVHTGGGYGGYQQPNTSPGAQQPQPPADTSTDAGATYVPVVADGGYGGSN